MAKRLIPSDPDNPAFYIETTDDDVPQADLSDLVAVLENLRDEVQAIRIHLRNEIEYRSRH